MVLITEELIRKRAEHNDGEISTLEELSLHQEDIEKIDNLQNWCRELKILYLQSNIISCIENLGKLKKLVYLNLALNNIEKLENLEGCESLEKLDLTLNFIGDLRDVTSLKYNYKLKQLFLVGNPCTDYEGYRQFVSTVLPHLQTLDGISITRSERIIASQSFPYYKDHVIQDYNEYRKRRMQQKLEESLSNANVLPPDLDNEQEVKQYWSRSTKHTPETRVQLAKDAQMMRERKKSSEEKNVGKPRMLFNSEGRPWNINEAKVEFKLIEDFDNNCLILDIAVYRYMDSSYLEVDVQPEYVKVLIKGKIFQIVLNHEILTEQSTAKRSTTTGHLVITMPLLQPMKLMKPANKEVNKIGEVGTTACKPSRREMLEIGSSKSMDFSCIAKRNEDVKERLKKSKDDRNLKCEEKIPSALFVDNSDVPPLE
ncbi:hypothetical protein J437_LFUL018007 [Ladona fulva]|uniref:Dynein axonemal assembly factor 11-like CS domain-containing protein n=1 Tax=Ladona fulva TaxID=123851 RepID=A0A8K0P9D1_LADFU|nr:hypothetical protein J437_LFUL018007 [Ladona fulva]